MIRQWALAPAGGGSLPEPIPAPAETRRGELTETLHGVAITDPYRWLEDQDSPETREWIAAQDAYANSVLALAPHKGRPLERPPLGCRNRSADRRASLLALAGQRRMTTDPSS